MGSKDLLHGWLSNVRKGNMMGGNSEEIGSSQTIPGSQRLHEECAFLRTGQSSDAVRFHS